LTNCEPIDAIGELADREVPTEAAVDAAVRLFKLSDEEPYKAM
jgi:hypothetical protein